MLLLSFARLASQSATQQAGPQSLRLTSRILLASQNPVPDFDHGRSDTTRMRITFTKGNAILREVYMSISVNSGSWYIKRAGVFCLIFSLVLLGGTLTIAHRIINKREPKANAPGAQRTKLTRKNTVSKHCPNKKFEINCELPFEDHVIHEIDERCPSSGICTAGDRTRFQNQIKNNLCAKSTLVEIGIATLDRLQQVVDDMVAKREITYGSLVPPKSNDRARLKSLSTVDINGNEINLGEGAVVVFEGFVLDAKHDNTFPLGLNGETVNCNKPGLNWNDIHIVLGPTETSPDCSSVSAKVSPHFRPALWERFDSNPATSKFVLNPLPVKGLRVRIRGQLFLDGNFKPKPCRPPRRRTSWEIHPVYAIEVFDSSLNRFVSIEEWARGK